MQPAEKFARLSSHTLRPQLYDDGFTAMTPELDKTFADSLATFLNSEYFHTQNTILTHQGIIFIFYPT